MLITAGARKSQPLILSVVGIVAAKIAVVLVLILILILVSLCLVVIVLVLVLILIAILLRQIVIGGAAAGTP